MNDIIILSTLGPSSLNEKTIKRLDEHGVDIFRINLSHTRYDDIQNVIELIRKFTNKPICLDTEGAQIRTGFVKDGSIELVENSMITLTSEVIEGDPSNITLTPSYILCQLNVGDLVSVDFDTVLLTIIKSGEKNVEAKVITGGIVGSNKAVSVDRQLNMNVISDDDVKAIKLGRQLQIKHYALSFASSHKAVTYFRSLIGDNSFLISKIESKQALLNINDILNLSDAALIDRGDLSREEPIDKIPLLQRLIIKKANEANVPIYVATNLLETMINQKRPTRAEVNDIISTLFMGANGLVLAAETAIGKYPIESMVMVKKY